MVDKIRIAPNLLTTEYLRNEDDTILQTESGRRIILDRMIDGGYTPVRIYDYEHQLNENKREILVVDNRYFTQINDEFRKLIVK